MKLYSTKNFCIFIFILFFQTRMQADHLYGGQMTYKMVDSAQGVFEVTLILERPCTATPLNTEYAIHVLEFYGSVATGKYQKNVYVAKLIDSNYFSLPCYNNGSSCTNSNTQLIEQKTYKVNIIIQQSQKECVVYFKENFRSTASNISNPDAPLLLFVSFLPNYINSKISFKEIKRHLPLKNQLSKIEYQKSDFENDSLLVTCSAPLIGISYTLNESNLIYQLEKSIFTTGNNELKPFPISQSQLDIQQNSISFTPTTAQAAWLTLIQSEYRKINLGVKDTWIKISCSNSDRLLTVQDINSQFHLNSISSPQPNVNIQSQSITICNKNDSSTLDFKFPIEKTLGTNQLKIYFDSISILNYSNTRNFGNVIDTIIVSFKYRHSNFQDINSKLYFNFELCHSASGLGFEKKIETPITIFNYIIFSTDTIKTCTNTLTIPVQIQKLFSTNWGQVLTNPYSIFIPNPRDTILIATLTQSNAYCPFRDTMVIDHGSEFTSSIIGYSPKCKGSSDGAARVFVTGTNLPYTFLWSNFSTQDTIGSISAGIHIVKIKDKDGCIQHDTVEINDASGIEANWIVDTPITCYNGSNGFGHFVINSTKKPYKYEWSHSTSTDSFLGSFAAGAYMGKFLYINNTGGNCQQNFTINFAQPEPIKLQTITTDNKCFGDSLGKIALIPSGGFGIYKFYFDSMLSSSGLKTNLKNGTYKTYVSDANNCISPFVSTVIKSPAIIDFSFTKYHPSCAEVSNGSLSINHSTGGVQPFQYSVNNSNYTGINLYPYLTANTYTVKVKDDNGCVVQKSTSLYPQYSLTASIDSMIHSLCPASRSGKIYLNISNGLAPFKVYKSLDTQLNYSRKINYQNLSKGFHTLKIKDENQCTWTGTYIISEPDSFIISTTVKDESCYQYNDGKININTIAGGTIPYYSSLWFNSSNQAITRIDSLAPDKYNFKLVDKNGCAFSKEFTILAKPIFRLKIDTIQSIKCYGTATGHLRANILGGTQPLVFRWNNNSNLNQVELQNLSAGNYQLLVKDNENCLASSSAILSNPDSIRLEILKVKNQDCPLINNGVVTITCSGGTTIGSKLKYAISPSLNFSEFNSFSQLSKGNYMVYVKDDNRCLDSFSSEVYLEKSIEISIPPQYTCELGEMIFLQPILTYGDNTSTSDIGKIVWNPQSNISCIDCIETQYTATQSGTYSLHINYGNGCTALSNIYFNVAKPEEIYIPNSFTPNNDLKNDQWLVYGKNIKAIDIKLFNKVGELLFYSTDILKGWDGTYKGKQEYINSYRYIINAKYIDGTIKKYDGIVNLIR
jgi:gliding motility-associated-like protein